MQAYLKFCCQVQGIRNELFAANTCKVVALDEIKLHYPQGTTFEDYWPPQGSIEPVHIQRAPARSWNQNPASSTITAPTSVSAAPPSANPAMAQSYRPLAAAASSWSNAAAALQHQQQQNVAFNGKLTQIKEFPMDRSHLPPYKLQNARIDSKIVSCINVRPYTFHDLMMTLPEVAKHFCSDLTIEKARQLLQDNLKVVLYKGNR